MNKRLFISIALPPAWLDLFERYKKEHFLRVLPAPDRGQGQAPAGIHWIEKVNLHLTVHFIGATPEPEIVNIRKKLENISAGISPFTLEFSKIDFAPPGKPKRMIWAYFLPSKNFENLVQKIRDAIGDRGAGHTEPPLPHATLARFKDDRSLRGFKLEGPQPAGPSNHSERAEPRVAERVKNPKLLTVNSFELQESELLSSGARYHVLHSFLLKGGSSS